MAQSDSPHGNQPEQTLQMLMVLFMKKNEEENYLSVTPTDPAETRLGFLKFVQALFCQCMIPLSVHT